MKRKMMKIAMLYIADLVEDVFPDNEEITTEKFINMFNVSFEYQEVIDGSRVDGILKIFVDGYKEAVFNCNIGM